MNFRKIDSQYHSCIKEAQQIQQIARRYNADCDELSGSSSKYFTIYFEQEDVEKMSSASCRVSRHEPNYALRGDDDIMVYICSDWLGTATSFCKQFEKYFECKRPQTVKSYLKRLANMAKKREKKRIACETEYQRLNQIHLKEAGEQYKAVLRQRCEQQKITKEKIEAAFAGKDNEDLCGIYTQLRKWFILYSLEEALEFCA